MFLKLTMDMDNAAFHETTPGDEVATILRRLADEIEGSNMEDEAIKLMDTNGNSVGWMETEKT